MNRTVTDAAVGICHCDDLESLKAHVLAFANACNLAKHLKTACWRTRYEVIRDA